MQNDKVSRVLAIHDLCVFGRCSLSAVVPVMSARGVQCCPLPAALLSAPTNYEKSTMLALTGELSRILSHLCSLEIGFDAVYSGFLFNPEQVFLTEKAFCAFPDALRVVDPVLGDNGRLYRTMDAAMVAAVRRLAAQAHLITPNVTEAAVLLGLDAAAAPSCGDEVTDWLERLSLGGTRSVALTGISLDRDDEIVVGWADSGNYGRVEHPRAGGSFPGTGDIFTAHLLAALLNGEPLSAAVDAAARFVCQCAALTIRSGTPPEEGLLFESVLRGERA